jgi:hypothetical protein
MTIAPGQRQRSATRGNASHTYSCFSAAQPPLIHIPHSRTPSLLLLELTRFCAAEKQKKNQLPARTNTQTTATRKHFVSPNHTSHYPSEQSRRDCALQPRVARNELPWVDGIQIFNPNGLRRFAQSSHKSCALNIQISNL